MPDPLAPVMARSALIHGLPAVPLHAAGRPVASAERVAHSLPVPASGRPPRCRNVSVHSVDGSECER